MHQKVDFLTSVRLTEQMAVDRRRFTRRGFAWWRCRAVRRFGLASNAETSAGQQSVRHGRLVCILKANKYAASRTRARVLWGAGQTRLCFLAASLGGLCIVPFALMAVLSLVCGAVDLPLDPQKTLSLSHVKLCKTLLSWSPVNCSN
jgi:hypothetical protein